jgi:hypothetical protein
MPCPPTESVALWRRSPSMLNCEMVLSSDTEFSMPLSSLPRPQAYASAICASRSASNALAWLSPNTCVELCAVNSTSFKVLCISLHRASVSFSLSLRKRESLSCFLSLSSDGLSADSKGRDRALRCRVIGSRLGFPCVVSFGSWRETESCEVFRDGGPTKREGAGRRLGLVFAVGEGLFGLEADVVVDMALNVPIANESMGLSGLGQFGIVNVLLYRSFSYVSASPSQLS